MRHKGLIPKLLLQIGEKKISTSFYSIFYAANEQLVGAKWSQIYSIASYASMVLCLSVTFLFCPLNNAVYLELSIWQPSFVWRRQRWRTHLQRSFDRQGKVTFCSFSILSWFFVLGIVSFGFPNASNPVSFFTKISAFSQWIEENRNAFPAFEEISRSEDLFTKVFLITLLLRAFICLLGKSFKTLKVVEFRKKKYFFKLQSKRLGCLYETLLFSCILSNFQVFLEKSEEILGISSFMFALSLSREYYDILIVDVCDEHRIHIFSILDTCKDILRIFFSKVSKLIKIEYFHEDIKKYFNNQ